MCSEQGVALEGGERWFQKLAPLSSETMALAKASVSFDSDNPFCVVHEKGLPLLHEMLTFARTNVSLESGHHF